MSSSYKDWQISGHGLMPARHVLCVAVRSVCRTAGHKEGLRAGLVVAPCQSRDPTHLENLSAWAHPAAVSLSHTGLCPSLPNMRVARTLSKLLKMLLLLCARTTTRCELTEDSLFIMWASMRCPLSPSATVGSSVWGDSRDPHWAQASITV